VMSSRGALSLALIYPIRLLAYFNDLHRSACG